MEPVHAVDVGQITPSACLASAKRPMIKYIPKGKLTCGVIWIVFVLILANQRYVEMLEQQQAWLVYGLQELYRRTSDGHGWPGEPLKCEANGHPLTHDLLTRLGALDQSKGDHFEESPEMMQQKLWTQKPGHMQRQESSDGSSESPQSPVGSSRFSDVFGRHHHLPPTPPSFSPSSRNTTATTQPPIESESQLENPAFAPQLSMQGVVNPIALQGPQQWSSNGFSPFDEMDLMGPNDYTNMSFDEQPLPSPIYNRQIPLNCMTSPPFMDTKSEYEDFNQFLNPNSTEITSI